MRLPLRPLSGVIRTLRWGNRPSDLWIAEDLGFALQTDGGNEVRICGLKQ
jgi:hypothetical protein